MEAVFEVHAYVYVQNKTVTEFLRKVYLWTAAIQTGHIDALLSDSTADHECGNTHTCTATTCASLSRDRVNPLKDDTSWCVFQCVAP